MERGSVLCELPSVRYCGGLEIYGKHRLEYIGGRRRQRRGIARRGKLPWGICIHDAGAEGGLSAEDHAGAFGDGNGKFLGFLGISAKGSKEDKNGCSQIITQLDESAEKRLREGEGLLLLPEKVPDSLPGVFTTVFWNPQMKNRREPSVFAAIQQYLR